MNYSDHTTDPLHMSVPVLMVRMAEVQEQLAQELNTLEVRFDDRSDSEYASVCVAELQNLDSIRQQISNMAKVLILLASRYSEGKVVPVAEVRATLNLHGLAHRLITGRPEEKKIAQFSDTALHLF